MAALYISQKLPEINKVKYIGSVALGEELTNYNIENETLNDFELSTLEKSKEPL